MSLPLHGRVDRVLQLALRAAGVRSRFVDTDLARHHVYEASGTGTLPPIVLLHGLADSAVTSVPMLRHLRARARRVVILEAAGHGLSPPAPTEYTSSRHLASMAAALDAVVDEPAILVGNSLGGATALRYAYVRPERVRALFLTSPGGAPCDEAEAAALRETFTLRSLADARAFIDRVHARRPLLAPVLAHFVHAHAAVPAVVDILQSLEHEHVRPEELAALTMPTLVMWGKAERILSPGALAYFRAHLPPHAAIIEPDHVGHCPHLDAPAWLARRITAFAAEVAEAA